jgi:hypothetical protein
MTKLNQLFLSIFYSLLCLSINAQTIVQVNSSDNWSATGYFKDANDDLIICSKGEVRAWSIDLVTECWRLVTPSGIGRVNFTSTSVPCPDCPVLSLIGKIGQNGIPFYVGDRCVLQASATNISGQLFLRINDGTLNDNTGSWEVSIANNCDQLTNYFTLPTYSPGTIQINSSADWVSTGVIKNPGEEVIFCGKGEIRAWSIDLVTECWRLVTPAGLGRLNFINGDFPCPTCPILSLVGKIGANGQPFYVGDRAVLQDNNGLYGEIYLRVNDFSVDDNTGDFAVTIAKTCNEMVDCYNEQLISDTKTLINLGNKVFDIYPNPTNDFINIALNANKSALIVVRMFDLSGKLLKTANFDITNGEQTLTMNIPESIQNQMIMIQTTVDNQNYSKLIMVK